MLRACIQFESDRMTPYLSQFVYEEVSRSLDDMLGSSLFDLLEKIREQRYHYPDSDSREYCVSCGRSPYRGHDKGCLVHDMGCLIERVRSHVNRDVKKEDLRKQALARMTPEELEAFKDLLK